ncbi:MAG: V-type ATPase subunit [Oscillospiraceae bacterium]
MPKTISDYDYLSVSARIHAMENRLLTHDRMERMLEARTAEEAAKVLTECGYQDLEDVTPVTIEGVLSAARVALYKDLSTAAPNPLLVDVFSMKYDYHNAKVLLKARAMDKDPAPLLVDAGRYPAKQLQEDFYKDDLRSVSELFRTALLSAADSLAQQGDPQLADFILDRAYFAEMLKTAEDVGSPFLTDYVKLSIDVANLRATVRALRMARDGEFLRKTLIPGGALSTDTLLSAASGSGDLAAAVGHGPLEAAALAGAQALEGGSLTQFERLCDNALNTYLASAKRVAFGPAPIIGYLYAREAEFTAIRIILTGRLAGLDSDILRERLRDAYV